ncbi:phage terminase large subunit family protein [Endozoicomonas montiporae]|uniref:DNA packaging protein of prophage (Terminase large subunit) n=1 Tax=Endozoicomonas montiporae CL-33 TaxID=570277 RepID=A0A142BA63_9GAMM|nr:terminase gpA endonuclease subunit [Endozoicomonas montiporae]AMO55639.1 DNA packaging protein of prophage (terminase large subunit) [Endozoicomonas montiporae CL-33]
MMIKHGSAEKVRFDIAGLLKPPQRLKVSEAITRYVWTKGPSGNYQPWDPEVAPYILEPLDLLNSRKYRGVIFAGPARTAKTNALVDGFLGYDVKCDPSQFLIVQMSKEKASEFSKTRITPMLENSPKLRECISPRGHDNNIFDRRFRSGNFLKIGHPSKRILSGSDFRRVVLTDYDKHPRDIGGEGEAWGMALKRTQTFGSRGMCVAEGSPGFEVIDPKWKATTENPHEAPPTVGILSLYNIGDRRLLYWQCPECQMYFPARFEYLDWDKEETDIKAASETVVCNCPICGICGSNAIPPSEKARMMNSAVWVPEGCKVDKFGQLEGEPRRSDFASFWMEGPAAAFQTWQQLVFNLLSALQIFEKTNNEGPLRLAVNTDIGRPFLSHIRAEARTSDSLKDRAEETVKRTIPLRARFSTASVDVQGGKKRRFVVQVHAYGEGMEKWVVDRYNIRHSERKDDDGNFLPIDPSAYPEDWDLLIDQVINKSYPLADDSGRRLAPLLAAIDIGGEKGTSGQTSVTDQAYKFYRRAKRNGHHRRIMLVKGASGKQQSLIKESFPDNTRRKDRKASAAGDVPIYLLATNELKDQIANALSRETPGPGYIHFPDWLGEWFFDELTYEVRNANGVWEKPGKGANEAFDLCCYSLAAAIHKGAHKIVDWDNAPAWARPLDQNSEVLTDERSPANVPPRRRRSGRRTRFKIG